MAILLNQKNIYISECAREKMSTIETELVHMLHHDRVVPHYIGAYITIFRDVFCLSFRLATLRQHASILLFRGSVRLCTVFYAARVMVVIISSSRCIFSHYA